MALYERLATDVDFRQKMQSDPRAALAEEGADVPDSVNIEVVESTGDTLYIALPPLKTDELSEDDLAGVSGAGGIDIWTPIGGGGISW